MHILGSAILTGYILGPATILGAPIVGIFGWFFVFPEAIGVILQWALYDPYPKPKLPAIIGYAALSAIVGGLIVGTLIPKEVGNEQHFFTAGALAGAGAAVFSFLCVHFIKMRASATLPIEQNTSDQQPGQPPSDEKP